MPDYSQQNIQEINNFISKLQKKFTPNKTLMAAISIRLRESAKSNIEDQGASVPGGWPKKMFPGKALLVTRNLFNSIQSGANDNTAFAFTNRRGAALMHFGGEVKAKKKLGSVKRKKDVWAMEQYFWSQYYKSDKKEKLFKILALHMQKHNSITVPARPFMYLNEKFRDLIIEDIRNYVSFS